MEMLRPSSWCFRSTGVSLNGSCVMAIEMVPDEAIADWPQHTGALVAYAPPLSGPRIFQPVKKPKDGQPGLDRACELAYGFLGPAYRLRNAVDAAFLPNNSSLLLVLEFLKYKGGGISVRAIVVKRRIRMLACELTTCLEDEVFVPKWRREHDRRVIHG